MGPITEPPGLGSSPHARGTRAAPLSGRWPPQFIPAYAGNAGPVTVLAWPPTVHPRMRGERRRQHHRYISCHGSSPHTRGTRNVVIFRRGGFRFIPAYAGNARKLLGNGSHPSVHPRIRGERLPAHRERQLRTGSSPHTRGTPSPAMLSWRYPRFIPAYAGNARHVCHLRPRMSVHPRIRGERCTCLPTRLRTFGSSPHARGTHRRHHLPHTYRRFIPACAGNASGVFPSSPSPSGSSPHARGTLGYRHPEQRDGRFIPACAGNARS